MAKKRPTRQQRREAATERRQSTAEQLLAAPSGEKLENKGAEKGSHPKKQKKGQQDVSRPGHSKNWEPFFAVILVTLVGLIPAITGFNWSEHPARSLWGTVVPLLLLNLVTYWLLTRKVWQASYSRRFIRRLFMITGILLVTVGILGQIWISRQPQDETDRERPHRRLTSAQRLKLIETFRRGSRDSVSVSGSLGDGESYAFAVELEGVFRNAGWPTDGTHQSILIPPTFGVTVRARSNSPGARTVLDALKAEGFTVMPETDEQAKGVHVIVGPKP